MAARTSRGRWGVAALTACTVSLGTVPAAWAANDVLDPSTALYVDFHSTSVQAAAGLAGQAQDDALLLASFPTATWLTKGTPDEVRATAREVVSDAAAQGQVPTLVPYNLPFRDCAQYSAGGATTVAEYTAWIDAVAAGIGDAEAVVVLEPDSLGIIPWYTTINGQLEWCQPAEADAATAAADRFAMLNHAVDVLTALPSTAVYLDGTHSGWLGVGDAADRLVAAGVERADGFYLNASNYQETRKLEKYGAWISQCIYYGTNPAEGGWRLGHFEYCASQYYPATPSNFDTWGLTDQWYLDNVANAANPPSGPDVLAHFVIDTSRNGQGPWTPPAGVYPDPQDWCNPPDRGLGLRPTTDTGDPLIDAYLWIKVPGESDGQCTRGTTGPQDPARGMVDPPAGVWFLEQAAELIAFAVPPVEPQTCDVAHDQRGSSGQVSTSTLRLTNTGTTPVQAWELMFALDGDRDVTRVSHAAAERSGDLVTLHGDRTTRPGKHVTVTYSTRPGAEAEEMPPLLFLLDGAPCTVS